MSEAIIAAREPAVLELEPGIYYWCSCGKSVTQPFCDGSHEATGCEPRVLEITEKETVALCQCKQSDNAPFCDGSHSTL